MSIIDKSIDFVFSKDNRKWVLLLVILGLIIRIISALHHPFYADEMVHGTHTIGFIDSGKLQIMDEDAVWFWMNDFFMGIFGTTVFGLRFFAILMGSLSIILIYLIGKQVFNEKIALIASFIFTFSPFQIIHIEGLMDIPMEFFALFALYSLIMFFKTDKMRFFYLIWISLGVAIMVKQIALFFIPALIISLIYYNKKYKNSFKIKQLIIAGLIILIMVTPVLAFNYLLYKDKGIVDVQFSRFTGIASDTYQGISSTMLSFSPSRLLLPFDGRLPGIVQALQMFYTYDNILVILFALIGIFFLFKLNIKFKLVFILTFAFPFIFLAGTSLLSNHFVFVSFYTSLLASLGISIISDKFSSEKFKTNFLYIILILILILSTYKVYQENNGLFGSNEITQLVDFKYKNIEKDSLVITDSRIYRGRIAFMFWDRHYIETSYISELFNQQEQLPGQSVPINIYFIEAATDDSGWGTIKDQPDFNTSSEAIAAYFKSSANLIKTIDDTEGKPHFKVYRLSLQMKPQLLSLADTTHSWFYYPVAYKPESQIFDNYVTYTTLDNLLDSFAHFILYLDIILAFLLIFNIFYLLYKNS